MRRPYISPAEFRAIYGCEPGGSPLRLPKYDLRQGDAAGLTKAELAEMLAELYGYYRFLADECVELIELKERAEARTQELENLLHE